MPFTGPLFGAILLSAVYCVCSVVQVPTMRFRRRWVSLSAGVSMAYVFVDVLPELEVQSRVLMNSAAVSLFSIEKRIYIFALLGFVLFYGLGRLHLLRGDRIDTREEHNPPDLFFLFHISGFALYNIVIGYLLVNRTAVSEWSLELYVFAMALHIVVMDHELVQEHGGLYMRWGRAALAVSVLAGWFLSIAGWLSQAAFSRLFAFVAGGVVIMSANTELPKEKEARFWWFASGAFFYATVLLLV